MGLSAVVGGTWRDTTTKFVLKELLRARACLLGPPRLEAEEPAQAVVRRRRPGVEDSAGGARRQEGAAPQLAEEPLGDEARLQGAALEAVTAHEAADLVEEDRPEVAEAFGRASPRKVTTKRISSLEKMRKNITKTRRSSRSKRPH